jgi:uncharacterized protein
VVANSVRCAVGWAVGLVGLPLLVLQAPLAASFPKSAGYVNDFASILDAQSKTELESMVRLTEKETSAEIAVATVSSLDGMTVEEYANRLFHEWGIGKKDRDNGVLVLVAPSERKARIEVGYGLEPILPDGLAGEIMREEILPLFRESDYSGGTLAGVRRISAIVRAGHVLTDDERRRFESSSDRPPALLMLPFLGLFVAIGGFMIGAGLRTKTIFPLLFGGIFGGIPLLMSFIPFLNAPVFVLGPLAVAMGVLGFRKSKPEWWRTSGGSPTADTSSGWTMGASDSTSSDSSSSSDSGSSFGGGDSGGGGASGSW